MSSGVKKSGTVEHIIPRGRFPQEFGVKIDGGLPRNHESYIVKATTENASKKRTALYWPRVSLLTPEDQLTPEELAWCKTHPKEVREAMKA